jgi:hypothetical protein
LRWDNPVPAPQSVPDFRSIPHSLRTGKSTLRHDGWLPCMVRERCGVIQFLEQQWRITSFSHFFAMDQACLDLSNESDMISEIISFTTDPISMPDATKKKNSKGKNTSKITWGPAYSLALINAVFNRPDYPPQNDISGFWESIYKFLKAGDLKNYFVG